MVSFGFVAQSTKPRIMTKQAYAHAHLREKIMSGAMRPGERVIIDQVAAALDMSPIPVREAISQLAREGLLDSRAHAGAVVAGIPESAIEEIFAAMEALETAAVRLGRRKADAQLIAELTALCEQMEKTSKMARWATLNRRFHEALPRFAGLERITGMLVKVGEDWERLRRLNFASFQGEDLSRSNREHREFVELLKAGRTRPLEKWIRDHNRHALQRYGMGGREV